MTSRAVCAVHEWGYDMATGCPWCEDEPAPTARTEPTLPMVDVDDVYDYLATCWGQQ